MLRLYFLGRKFFCEGLWQRTRDLAQQHGACAAQRQHESTGACLSQYQLVDSSYLRYLYLLGIFIFSGVEFCSLVCLLVWWQRMTDKPFRCSVTRTRAVQSFCMLSRMYE